MAIVAKIFYYGLLFFSPFSICEAGFAEKAAMQALQSAYKLSVSVVLAKAADSDFGNRMVNRFLVKLDNKIKDGLKADETSIDLVEKLIEVLDFSGDNIQALKRAVSPVGMCKVLDGVCEAMDILKSSLSIALQQLKDAKETDLGKAVATGYGSYTG